MPSSERRHRRSHGRPTASTVRRIQGAVLLGAATAAILFATLLPSGDTRESHGCLVCGDDPGVDVVLNILLFLPVGAALALLGAELRRALMIAILLTVAVEVLQLVLPIGRIASVADVVANGTGAALGYALAANRRALLYPRSRRALRLAAIAAGAWMILLVVTSWGLLPGRPEPPYSGEWSPRLGGFDLFSGRVIEARLSGVPLPNGPLPQSEEVHDAVRAGVRLDATAEPGGGTRRLAPIVRAVGRRGREILLMGQLEDDALYRAQTHSDLIGLLTPTVVLTEAFAGLDRTSSERARLSAQRDRGALHLAAQGRSTTLLLHPGSGWMLFVPGEIARVIAPDLMSTLWVATPMFVITYWVGRRARRRARRSGDSFRMTGTAGGLLLAAPALALLAAAGLAGVALLFGLAVAPLPVWAGAAAGSALGLGVGVARALSHTDRARGGTRVDHIHGEDIQRSAATSG